MRDSSSLQQQHGVAAAQVPSNAALNNPSCRTLLRTLITNLKILEMEMTIEAQDVQKRAEERDKKHHVKNHQHRQTHIKSEVVPVAFRVSSVSSSLPVHASPPLHGPPTYEQSRLQASRAHASYTVSSTTQRQMHGTSTLTASHYDLVAPERREVSDEKRPLLPPSVRQPDVPSSPKGGTNSSNFLASQYYMQFHHHHNHPHQQQCEDPYPSLMLHH